MQHQPLLNGVFFLFFFFIQNLGLVCVGRHTCSCIGSSFKCGGAAGRLGEIGMGIKGGRGHRCVNPVISDSIWTWESRFEEDS